MLRNKIRTTHTLSINEIYTSIQGEGLLVGTPSVFVRFQGCNIRCPWCDQPDALQFSKANTSVKEVIDFVLESNFRHVVITGGEPMAHEGLAELVRALLDIGRSVQIETNGTIWREELEPFAKKIHITCSPKAVVRFSVHPKILEYAKELKFVVDRELEAEVLLREEFRKFLENSAVVLQPESNRHDMFRKAMDIQREVAARGFSVRLIPQIHKFFGIL